MKIGFWLALAALLATHSAAAKTLNVAMYGEDGPDCGSRSEPCRTITVAIANADGDDIVEVGPGLYGDLNRDGDLNDDFEEGALAMGVCLCAVDLNKDVTLRSRDGADVTLIEAGPALRGVRINANGATLGAINGGFTITGATNGIFEPAGIENVRVIGNTVRGSTADGFFTAGEVAYQANRSIRNVVGFSASTLERVTFEDCVAQGNSDIGFNLTASDTRVRKSVAVGNGLHGFFSFDGTDDVAGVASIGNAAAGVAFNQTATPVRGSSIFGNGIPFAENCGLYVTLPGLEMPGNFWGAPTGAGPDPADGLCPGSLDVALTPPRKTEVKVVPKATR